MAADAKRLGVGDFQCRVEAAPEHHTCDESTSRQKR
jgi:hypothetical protein